MAIVGADRPTVVVVCGDPGGASAMGPVLERLRAEGQVVSRAFAYREARSVWKSAGLHSDEISESLDEAAAAQLLVDEGAAVLAVGTSVNRVGLEKLFVRAARRAGVPSLALLDFWSSYVDRFSDASGALASVPDFIAVMDDVARSEMIDLGFDPVGLIVTGQPAFDALPAVRKGFSERARVRNRRTLGAGADARLVVFVSQPLAAVYGSAPSDPGYLGFTERDVLAAVVQCLRKLALLGNKVVLAVLPHPRERVQAFAALDARPLRAVVSTGLAPREVVMSADLVVGMNSIMLMEACFLGCPTLSLQPGLRRGDMLPTNRMGVSKAVYDAADIDGALADLLLSEESRGTLLARLARFQPGDTQAARRVVQLLYRMSLGTSASAVDSVE